MPRSPQHWRRGADLIADFSRARDRIKTIDEHPRGRGDYSVGTLAFIDDLNIVAVRIKHPSRIIARIVFETSLR